jgi:hypothetical protein
LFARANDRGITATASDERRVAISLTNPAPLDHEAGGGETVRAGQLPPWRYIVTYLEWEIPGAQQLAAD